jgi:protein gp37
MAGKTKIEWTEQTWNPIVGCSIVSPGCTNCYAMKMAHRIQAMSDGTHGAVVGARGVGLSRYEGTTKVVNDNTVWTGKLHLASEHVLTAPLRRKKPTTYFVNSMGDLFHEDCPDEWIDKVFAVMALCPQHTFQVLTKRAERMLAYLTLPYHPGQFQTVLDDGRVIDTPAAHIRVHSAMCDLLPKAPASALNRAATWQDKKWPDGDGFIRSWPLPNVWLGVSAEDQKRADERIPHLLATPAAVRFVSAEPLLGALDLFNMDEGVLRGLGVIKSGGVTASTPHEPAEGFDDSYPGLDWVIVGGESGPNARPMHPDWARSLRDQCAAAGVPFFFKQWGEWAHPEASSMGMTNTAEWMRFPRVEPSHVHVFDGGANMGRIGKKAAGRLLDGEEHNGYPASPSSVEGRTA